MDSSGGNGGNAGEGDKKDSSYVQVIPVEYNSMNNRQVGSGSNGIVCGTGGPSPGATMIIGWNMVGGTYGQNGDYVDQYRVHDDYIQPEEPQNQRIPPNNAPSYTNLCPDPDWDRDCAVSSSDTTKDGSSDSSDKHTNETTTTSAPSPLSGSTTVTPPRCEPFQGPVIPTCVYLHNKTAISMEIEDTPSATCELLCHAIANCDELALNKVLAIQVFTLWMHSPLLELQMKPTHKPYLIRRAWRSLVGQYSHGSFNRQQRDEPVIRFQRNVFYPQHLEEKIKDPKLLELLYEEARHNVLEGRYPCESGHYIMLGGIQARIELGPYNPQVHSTHYFREEQAKFLPAHVRKSATWTWLPISSKGSAEVRLLEQFKRIPASATTRKLVRKYLEFCWSLPFYGSAFFEGQIEQPVRGLTSLITHQDIPVLVGVNSKGVFVIDDLQCTLLLGLRFEELSWEYARPSNEENPNCLPCLFLQFLVVENGARVSKILQVFSRQASLMDTLISGFVQQLNKGKLGGSEDTDRVFEQQQQPQQPQPDSTDTQASLTLSNLTQSSASLPSLSNKLSRLTLATFDEDGRCIGQMGSWSFSY